MASPEHLNVLREAGEFIAEHKIVTGIIAYAIVASAFTVFLVKRLKRAREQDSYPLNPDDDR